MPETKSIFFRPAAVPFVHPLDELYARAGLPLPDIERLEGAALPEPFRQLLVHQNDMTPTLKRFYQDNIHLRILRRPLRHDFYFRQVLLVLDRTEKIVEFGATKVNLALFPPAARRQILEERLPLGQILEEHQIRHSSRPKAFLRVQPDSFILDALKLSGAEVLFGRRNTLSDSVGRPLAEIVEILPPANQP